MSKIKIYEEGGFQFEFTPQGGTHLGNLVTRPPEMAPYAAEVNLSKIRSRAEYASDAADTWGLEKDSELPRDLKAALNALCVKRSEEVEAASEAEQEESEESSAPISVSEEKANELIGTPGVLQRLVEAAAAFSKVVKERDLLRLLFLVFLSAQLRLLPTGKPLGANCILTADASRGKNYACDAVARVLPEEFYFAFESSSPKSLFYKAKAEGPACLKHRAIYPNEAEAVDPLVATFRPVLSGGQAKLVTVDKNAQGENVEREYVLEGPMVLVVTTVRNKLDMQLQTRMLVAGLDDYEGRVAAHSGAVSEQLDIEYVGTDHTPEIAAWQVALRSLTGVRRVVVPVVHEKFRFASDEVSHGARLWTNFLGLMCTNAWLEQRNREVITLPTDEQAVVAAPEDYAVAYHVFEQTCERSIQNLSEAHRKILGAVYELQQEDSDADGFTQRKIAKKAGVSQSTVAQHKSYLTMSANLLREVEGAGMRLVADATPSWWEKGDLLIGFPRPSEVRKWWTEEHPPPTPESADHTDRPSDEARKGDVQGENADRPSSDHPRTSADQTDHDVVPENGDRRVPGDDRHPGDHENGLSKGENANGEPLIGVIGGLEDDEKGVDVKENDGRTPKPKMGIIEFDPPRYGLDNLHLGHPVLGSIFWCELSGELSCPWEGNLGELLELLNANVEDRVKRQPEWSSNPQELYEYLQSLNGHLFGLYGGDFELRMWDYSPENPEETRVLIELIFPDEDEDDEPDEETGSSVVFNFDFDEPDAEVPDEG